MSDKDNRENSWTKIFKEIFIFELIFAIINWICGAAKFIYRIVIIGFLLFGTMAMIWEKFFK